MTAGKPERKRNEIENLSTIFCLQDEMNRDRIEKISVLKKKIKERVLYQCQDIQNLPTLSIKRSAMMLQREKSLQLSAVKLRLL